MTEPNLTVLHPLHFADWQLGRISPSHGLHGSFVLNLPRVSRSPELSRAYQVGDPVRLIDWKAYARTDQLIVREEKDAAMARIVVVLDARLSMHWPDKSAIKEIGENSVTKFAIATRIALHLVYRHLRMGDRVRLVVVGDDFAGDAARAFEPKSTSDVLSLFDALESRNFEPTSLEHFVSEQALFTGKTQLLYWVSDCCSGEIPETVYVHSDQVCLFHILSFLESDPSWFKDRTCYFDEFAQVKEFLGKVLKREDVYRTKLNTWRSKLRSTVDRNGGRYVFFTDRSTLRSYAGALDEVLKG